MIEAILFDLDGTLSDTESVTTKVFSAVCKMYGIEVSLEERLKLLGRTDRELYTSFFKEKDIAIDPEEALKKHETMYETMLRENEYLFPGVSDMLQSLCEDGYVLAIVSGSTHKQINYVLKQHIRLFKIVTSCEDIKNSKPDPESYLRTVDLLNMAPNQCVAVEESAFGIQSAKAAGIKVIGVVNLGGQDITKADTRIENIVDLPGVLQNNLTA